MHGNGCDQGFPVLFFSAVEKTGCCTHALVTRPEQSTPSLISIPTTKNGCTPKDLLNAGNGIFKDQVSQQLDSICPCLLHFEFHSIPADRAGISAQSCHLTGQYIHGFITRVFINTCWKLTLTWEQGEAQPQGNDIPSAISAINCTNN